MSARLVELPLGVFAIALSTILFPRLSRAMSEGNLKDYQSSFFNGVRIISMLTVPSAIGLFILGDLVIKTLFQWKEFGGENVYMASKVLSVIAWTIPLYALSIFLIKSFHSQKNMNVPLKAALISLLVKLFCQHNVDERFWSNGPCLGKFSGCNFPIILLVSEKSPYLMEIYLSPKRICLQKVMLASLCMYTIVTYCKEYIQFGVSKSPFCLSFF